MNPLVKIGRLDRKRILSLSAGSLKSGIQCAYIETHDSSWSTVAQTTIPYPPQIDSSIAGLLADTDPAVRLSGLAVLDQRLTRLFIDAARTVLAQTSGKKTAPSIVVMNSLTIWNGAIGGEQSDPAWCLSAGNAAMVASALGAPVLAGFVEHSIAAGHRGVVPIVPGLLRMIDRRDGVHVFVNVGLLSHLMIVDGRDSQIVLESDTGPGTCLINSVAQRVGIPDGFDRDGAAAAQGSVDHDALRFLLSAEWFSRSTPKHASLKDFSVLLDSPSISSLAPSHLLATVTALTARSIFELYRREYRLSITPSTVWLFGGGVYNRTLVEYLRTNFEPIEVKSIESLRIAPDCGFPLALGLSALDRLSTVRLTDTIGRIERFANIVWP